MQGNELRKKKKKFQLKKRQRFRKNHRRRHWTRARARINITPQTYGTEDPHSDCIDHRERTAKTVEWRPNNRDIVRAQNRCMHGPRALTYPRAHPLDLLRLAKIDPGA